MRLNAVFYFSWIALLILSAIPGSYTQNVWPREDITTKDQTTLTSSDGSNPTSGSTTSSRTDASTTANTLSTSVSTTQKTGTSASPDTTQSSTPNSTSPTSTATSSSSLSSTSSTSSAASTSSTASHNDNSLPLQPRITPALGIGGVFLILTGVTYSLIGVKNRWIHTFLSAAYLSSLAVAVLIFYVMTPPISDAIQGGYLVGIVMTGLIFGAGALIFKEITEGLGCLLGGFCLSMWLLTLVRGGLMTNSTGKGVFVGVFCAVFWSLSFSHYTRAYGLIGSTAFSGATAVVLGIDCFSRAGLKEFWVYVWGLNDNIFPLGTSTYPITRGCRVESIVIILGAIIGVMSQIRLWKIVRDKQHKREEAALDEQRRKEAVDQALGRHLERHNDKDRAVWERQYGNNTTAQRNTIPWTDTLSEKDYGHLSPDTPGSSSSSPPESVEMMPVLAKKGGSTHSSKAKRLTSVVEDVITEEQEDGRGEASRSIDSPVSARKLSDQRSSSGSLQDPRGGPEILSHQRPAFASLEGANPESPKGAQGQASNEIAPKRQSLRSMLGFSPPKFGGTTSESQEALVRPMSIHSRTSSIAATLDEAEGSVRESSPVQAGRSDSEGPQILVTPVPSSDNLKRQAEVSGDASARVRPISPSPSSCLSGLDDMDDPEELTREARKTPEPTLPPSAIDEKEPSQEAEASPEERPRRHSDAVSQSLNLTAKTSSTAALTPDALNHVPSRVSNVVTSYRTNEWAKHITTADEPMFDEPEVIKAIDAEPPTQIGVTSTAASTKEVKSSVEHPAPAKVDVLPPLATSTTADGAVIVNADQTPVSPTEEKESEVAAEQALSPRRSSSQIGMQRDAAVPNASTSSVNHPTTISPSRVISSKQPKWTSTGTTSRQVFTTPPITEGVPASFTPAPGLHRQSSAGIPGRTASSSSLALANNNISGVIRPGTSQGGIRTVSRSYSSTNLKDRRRLSGGTSTIGYNMPGALRSETRLASYESRQPQAANTTDTARREGLLAEWRMSQTQEVAMGGMPLQQVDTRRAQMLHDKEQKKAQEGQQKMAQQRQQYALDQMSRRPDMQDAHREAMRRMQAKTKV